MAARRRSQAKAAGKRTRAKAIGKQKDKTELMESLKDFVRTRGADYLRDKNITSVGVGWKVVDGRKQVAIQFTVARKASPEILEGLDTVPIPKSFTVAGVEVPTDVVQRKFGPDYRVVAEAESSDRKTRLDPIVPGISVANTNETAGTIGCIVFDKLDRTPYVLSNWHVLHGPDGAIGDDVVQPGPFDDNRSQQNLMGRLVRSHVGHAGDCAVATIDERRFEPEILELSVKVEKLGEPELGDKVIKSGRTTGVTHGIVSRVHTIAKIDYGGSVGEQQVGGFEIGIDQNKRPANGEVSMGGDSGSVWLFKNASGRPTNVMAGLHFAGEGPGDPNEHAVACYPKSVFDKLQISITPPEVVTEAAGVGFSSDFLSKGVHLPQLSTANKQQAFKLDGSEVIHYTHFSLSLNKARQFAFWVGWNVDGGRLRKVSRKGIPFVFDPRIGEEFQAGDELYAGNRLDRGHIARRADLTWGGLAEAKKANKDSFFFTNIAPQMDDFNQSGLGGIWGELEDAVFTEVDVEDLRVSLFGGPVFREDDRVFREVKIPREFWKVIIFVENGKLKAKGFLLTQSLDQLEALDLTEFKVFQVALTELEARCGLTFPAALKAADSIGERLARRPEAMAERRPIHSLAEVDWS
jgi:endonuclease G